MSLIDQFAREAMSGFIAAGCQNPFSGNDFELVNIAKASYSMAYAMNAERERRLNKAVQKDIGDMELEK